MFFFNIKFVYLQQSLTDNININQYDNFIALFILKVNNFFSGENKNAFQMQA